MEATPDTYPSLFLGYAVIWGAIVLFCVALGTRQRKLARELNELKSTMGDEQ